MTTIDDGLVFSDLLLLAAVVARCPAAALSIAGANGAGQKWATLAHGTKTENVDDPVLFSVIASCTDAVEIFEPGNNPALAGAAVAKEGSGVRWLCGVRLPGAPQAVLVVFDIDRHEMSAQERSAFRAVARFAASALQAHNKPLVRSMPGKNDLLHCKDVAVLFDVTERTVLNWAVSGKLPSLRTPSGGLRFRTEDVVAKLGSS